MSAADQLDALLAAWKADVESAPMPEVDEREFIDRFGGDPGGE